MTTATEDCAKCGGHHPPFVACRACKHPFSVTPDGRATCDGAVCLIAKPTCEAKLRQTLYATATGWPSTQWLRCGQVVGVRPVAGGFACSRHVEVVVWQRMGQ